MSITVNSDARLLAIAMLFALGQALPNGVLAGDATSGLVVIALAQLTGGLVLLFCALLLRVPWLPRPAALALGVVTGCLLGRMVAASLVEQHFANFPGGDPSYWTGVWFVARRQIVFWGILAAAWYLVDRAARREARLHASALARQHADSALAEARLALLHAQVEPHFLFNTLAHVRHLLRTDAALAREMLHRLCDYLCAAFPRMRGERSTLGDEVVLAAAYLDVQRLRMGERLAVEIDVGERDRSRPFPPMMLISLVENAIKHGIAPLAEGGCIRVSAESTPRALRVVVSDSGAGMSAARGTGIGLANIARRLAALYGGAARLTLAPNAPRGLRATIDIPLDASAP
jgi:signal transduction histidine kinase